MNIRSYTLVPNDSNDTNHLHIPGIYVLKDWSSQEKVLASLNYFAGCQAFSVWLHRQETHIAEGFHQNVSPSMLVNATFIGELSSAMGVLRFIPNQACLPVIKEELQAVRVKVMQEKQLVDDLLEGYQTRLFNAVQQDLIAGLMESPEIIAGKNNQYFKFQSAFLMCGEQGDIWQRLSGLPWTPKTLSTTIYYLERQDNHIGLLLHRLQINYSGQLIAIINKHQMPKTDAVAVEQDRLYLESLITDIFKSRTMNGVLNFCELEADTTILDYCVKPGRICETIIKAFTFIKPVAKVVINEEQPADIVNTSVTQYIQTVLAEPEPEPAEAVLVNDHFEEELALARGTLAERFLREQQQISEPEDYLEALVAADKLQIAKAKSQHGFQVLLDYQNILVSHIFPYLSFRDAIRFSSTCKEFNEQFGIFNNPELLLEMAKSSSPKQLYHFTCVKEDKIRELYNLVMSRVNNKPEVVRAVRILKALIMDVAEHDKEGVSLDMLIELRNYLLNLPGKKPINLIKSLDFILHLLIQRSLVPFVVVPDPYGDTMFAMFRAEIRNPKLYEDGGGFAPWAYTHYSDKKSVFYKNLRGFNLCLTNLEDCNWDYACFNGANIKTAHFGKNKLKHTVFQFSASLYGMMIARKHFGLTLPRVEYFTDEPTGHEVFNVLSLFALGHSWGMSYLFVSAIIPVGQRFYPTKITQDRHHIEFAVAAALRNEIQAEVLKQLLAAANRLATRGNPEQALIILWVAMNDDYFRKKRSNLRTIGYGLFSNQPHDLIKAEFERIQTQYKVAITDELQRKFSVRYEVTIVDNDLHIPRSKNSFWQ